MIITCGLKLQLLNLTLKSIMKSSITTMRLLFIMTSYLCEGCYLTNCPKRWYRGGRNKVGSSKGRSTRSIDSLEKQNQLLNNILRKIFNKVSFIKVCIFFVY